MIKQTLCFSNRAYLSAKLRQLVIELPETDGHEKQIISRPIEDIGVMIIESLQVTLTSSLINQLLENNVALITCDTHHIPSGLFLPLNGNTLQSERFQAQIEVSLPLKKQLWQQTVCMKIHNQGCVLQKWNSKTTSCMEEWSKNVKSNDSDNLEGRAAAFYWRNIFEDNAGFRRDRDSEDANILFNYGYAILRAVIARSLVGSGLLPTLGIHHHNRYNAYCLADDIMEPYRPYVDDVVMEILQEFGNDIGLTKEVKRKLLEIPVIDVNIGKLKRPMMIAASITTGSLARCYLGESRKITYPEM